MIAKVKSAGLEGLNGFVVEVEIDLANGLPAFDIVGLQRIYNARKTNHY